MERPLHFGRVHGHRGATGELTVRVLSGDATRWSDIARLWLRDAPEGEHAGDSARVSPDDFREFDVLERRTYGDRLVVRLTGVDDATEAASLRGQAVWAPPDEVPALDDGEYWYDRLIGARVVDDAGRELGRVTDVHDAAGNEVLEVRDDRDAEVLIPLVRAFVTAVDADGETIRVKLPAGLEELNAPEAGRGGAS